MKPEGFFMLTASPLIFSDAAASKVWSLIEEEGDPSLNLRAFITGGGCSGLQYGFMFDKTIKATDTVVEKQIEVSGQPVIVRLLVNPASLQLLRGAEIDYKEDLDGARFIIRQNPNAQTTCGCGSSFSMKEDANTNQQDH